jgi:hypothetical protein
MFVVAEHVLSHIVDEYGLHPVSIVDGGNLYPPQACKFLIRSSHSSPFGKNIIERTIQQYIKDRTKDCFDDYFPCIKN